MIAFRHSSSHPSRCLARRYPYIPGHGYSLQRYAVRTLLLNDRYQRHRCRVRTAYLGMQAKQIARLCKHRKLPDHLGDFDSPWKTLKELRRNWNSGPSGC